MSKFNMDDYVDVAERIAIFREKYPDGTLQQVSLDFQDFAGKSWVVYTAAAYRTPDDVRPGHGTAWEQVPGPTQFTRDSELQNAETAAWGRAIVAALAADTQKVASRQEVQARQPDPRMSDSDFTKIISGLNAAADEAALKAIWEEAKPQLTNPDDYQEVVDLIKELKKQWSEQ